MLLLLLNHTLYSSDGFTYKQQQPKKNFDALLLKQKINSIYITYPPLIPETLKNILTLLSLVNLWRSFLLICASILVSPLEIRRPCHITNMRREIRPPGIVKKLFAFIQSCNHDNIYLFYYNNHTLPPLL